MTTPRQGSLVEIDIASIAHGGEGVGRVNGKAHFVPGVMPGETVIGRVVKDGGNWARAELVEVRSTAAERVVPPCPHAVACGGCQWQHAAYESQLEWKQNTVISQLGHIAKLAAPPVSEIVAAGPAFGYRNRMEFRVAGGSPAMHRPRSHETVKLEVCELLDPLLAEVFSRLGDLAGVERITMRAGTNTGERLVIITGEVPSHANGWDVPLAVQRGRQVTGVDGPARLHEEIEDVRFRITGNAFFQNNSHGAAALVKLVREALEPSPQDTLLDAYAGVGLFSATLGREVDRVVAVESDRVAAGDLRRNLANAKVDHRVITGRMERVAADLDEYPSIAIADPPRSGLGESGVAAMVAGHPHRFAYISCDPASLARDTALLADYGYHLVNITPVDLFPQTFHIEAVALYSPVADL